MQIDTYIKDNLFDACRRLDIHPPQITLEISRQPEYGDLSSNIALVSAKQAKMSPGKLAELLAREFPIDFGYIESVEIAGPGFVNFHLSREYLNNQLEDIIKAPDEFGRSDEGKGETWICEFVSANPTGPLNIVSARAAAVGDSLIRILKRRGYNALAEYYVNDGGGQVRNLGGSLRARLKELNEPGSKAEIPDEGYHGGYVIDLAQQFRQDSDHSSIPDDDLELGLWAARNIRDGQEKSLKNYRVTFDRWFRESELYQSGRVSSTYDDLVSRGLTYEKDDAVWFRASDYGDSKDRVLKTGADRFTYIVPDIAYHIEKRDRGSSRAITILGPDHHGHIAQLSAALKAVGTPDDFFHPLLIQQVNLRRGGEEIKMSKRAGIGVSMDELVDEVGVDAARFFFQMRKTSSHLDFDIDLAKQHSDENPVFYVQYAHARIKSILRQPDAFEPNSDTTLALLSEPAEVWLLRMLARFPWTLSAVIRGLEPHPITVYLTDLAKSFHTFYQRHRVISDDKAMTSARIMLCMGVANVLKDGLDLIGVSAPERM